MQCFFFPVLRCLATLQPTIPCFYKREAGDAIQMVRVRLSLIKPCFLFARYIGGALGAQRTGHVVVGFVATRFLFLGQSRRFRRGSTARTSKDLPKKI
jgi:hypothetical protein